MHYSKFCKAMTEMGHSRRIGTPQHKRNVRFAYNSVQTLAPQRTGAYLSSACRAVLYGGQRKKLRRRHG